MEHGLWFKLSEVATLAALGWRIVGYAPRQQELGVYMKPAK